MHVVDVLAACLAVVLLVLAALVLARQRYMLRAVGAVPLAVRVRENRWVYGVGRYTGGQLRWYRSLGLATRPSRVLERGDVRILGHRAPNEAELSALPASAVVVTCRDGSGELMLALSEGAFTGFISWLEASAPLS